MTFIPAETQASRSPHALPTAITRPARSAPRVCWLYGKRLTFAHVPLDDLFDALPERSLRIVVEAAFGFGDIGVGDRHIPRLVRKPVDAGLLPKALLDGLNHLG